MDTEIINAHHEIIKSFWLDIWPIIDFASKNRQKYKFIASIDFYWNTYFSNYQIEEFLISELLEIENEMINWKNIVQQLISFSKQVGTHQYLKILWD